MATTYELVFWMMSTIGTITAMLIAIRNYNISERIRVFGHE